MKKWLAASLLLAALLAGLSFYYGAFDRVVIAVAPKGPYVLVVRPVTGNYRQAGDVMDEVYYSLLHENGLETSRGAGVYFDNPQNTDPDSCRALLGCLIDEAAADSLKLPVHARLIRLGQSERVATSFTFRGMPSVMFALSGSSGLRTDGGFQASAGGPIMEIHDVLRRWSLLSLIRQKSVSGRMIWSKGLFLYRDRGSGSRAR